MHIAVLSQGLLSMIVVSIPGCNFERMNRHGSGVSYISSRDTVNFKRLTDVSKPKVKPFVVLVSDVLFPVYDV